MFKKITKMALVCLAMLCMSSVQSPILTRPTVRIDFFDGLTMDVFVGQPFRFDIVYRNTDMLFIQADNEYQLTRLDIPENTRNEPAESRFEHFITINEYSTVRRYDVMAQSEDGAIDMTSISFMTPDPIPTN